MLEVETEEGLRRQLVTAGYTEVLRSKLAVRLHKSSTGLMDQGQGEDWKINVRLISEADASGKEVIDKMANPCLTICLIDWSAFTTEVEKTHIPDGFET